MIQQRSPKYLKFLIPVPLLYNTRFDLEIQFSIKTDQVNYQTQHYNLQRQGMLFAVRGLSAPTPLAKTVIIYLFPKIKEQNPIIGGWGYNNNNNFIA